jgi:F420-non-reducing hydrogenase large subunit
MKNVTLEPLRWQEDPVRITVYHDTEYCRAYYQVTAPRDLEEICAGRPVEELPRILTLLSPAHHLASAKALDRLFGVEPPPMALNMREGLLQAQFLQPSFAETLFFDFLMAESVFGPSETWQSRGSAALSTAFSG